MTWNIIKLNRTRLVDEIEQEQVWMAFLLAEVVSQLQFYFGLCKHEDLLAASPSMVTLYHHGKGMISCFRNDLICMEYRL